jgi:Cu2+-exporting ATPase
MDHVHRQAADHMPVTRCRRPSGRTTAGRSVAMVYGGLVFIRGACSELADHKPGMMTLISLAITVAFGTSLAATFGLFEVEVWWELASLITIMVLGHWPEMRAISQARGTLNAFAALLPDTAKRVRGAESQTVTLSELYLGDIVLVRPGTRVPADGTVVEGAADVDESMITGESRPVSKGPGASVIAGTVASGGSTRVRITAVRSRPPCPPSCGLLRLRKLLGLVRKLLPTVPRQPFSTWQ